MYYKATLDWLSIIITVFTTTLFLWILGQNIWLLNNKGGKLAIIVVIAVGALLIAMYVYCYLFWVKGYEVKDNKVIILRPAKNKEIEIVSIKKAFVPQKEDMKWTIRTLGNGGLFGYWGKFANTTFGNMTWYATRRSNYIMLIVEGEGKIVITPDDLSMIDEIQKKIMV